MKPTNIILIVMDAVRAQNMGCYGFELNTSPVIDLLAKKGILFKNAFSCTNTTDPAVTSLFTGMLPITHGLRRHGTKLAEKDLLEFYKKDIKTITYYLNKEDYASFGLDSLGKWHKKYFKYHSGRDKKTKKNKLYPKLIEFSRKIGLHKHLRYLSNLGYLKTLKFKFLKLTLDSKIFEKAKEIIRNENNFFLFIHFWGAHIPRQFSDKIMKKFLSILKADKNFRDINNSTLKSIAEYNAAIYNVDSQIEVLVNLLKKINKYEDTLIIITGDHGESLTEHGITFDHHGLYDVTIKVPLIFHWPMYFKESKEIKDIVQHIDLMPTLLNILDIKIPSNLDGYNLLPLINNRVQEMKRSLFVEENYYQKKEALRTARYKFIKDFNEGKKCSMCHVMHGDMIELYNLDKDPSEKNNIAKNNPEIVKHFENLLEKYQKK